MRTASAVRCKAVEAGDWPALERLFGAKGACAGCWCMYWRASYGGTRFEADKGDPNRSKFRELISTGRADGCLAWQDEKAVGWVSAGPRESFPYFARSRALSPLPGDRVWSITCFFVPADRRGEGIASLLLGAAVALARERGAKIVEGYPAVPKRGARMPAAFAWTGVPALYERAGFERVKHPSGRLVYRKRLKAEG